MTPTLAQFDFFQNPKDKNLLLAGQGSGKTAAIALIASHMITNFPKAPGLIAANTYQQLSNATLKRLFEDWQKLNFFEYNKKKNTGNYTVNITPPEQWSCPRLKSYDNIICLSNGATIQVCSLDNYKAIDGIEVGWACLDETKDTKEEAVKEVILGRLRHKGSPNHLWIFTSPAKTPWLMDMFSLHDIQHRKHELESKPYYLVHETRDSKTVIASTFTNIHNLPAGYIDRQLMNLRPQQIEMLVYGSPWGQTGGEFYNGFSDANVEHCEVDPTLPIHATFDFNTLPYLSVNLWQAKGFHIKCVGEYSLQPPNANSIEAGKVVGMQFKKWKPGVFIYGDPAGKSQDTRVARGENNYTNILAGLRAWQVPHQMRVDLQAPPVLNRANFINSLFEGRTQYKVTIDPKCEKLLADLRNVRQDANGKKDKRKVKNEAGQYFEPYGHHSDAMDYFLCAKKGPLGNLFANFQKSGTLGHAMVQRELHQD